MKTPKRTKVDLYQCPDCGSFAVLYDIEEKKEYLKCNTCGRVRHKSFFRIPAFENAIFARWKRKNREARLKHALQRQAWNAVVLAADFRCAELSASSWKKRYREIWRMQFWTTSTYGQDIEGS